MLIDHSLSYRLLCTGERRVKNGKSTTYVILEALCKFNEFTPSPNCCTIQGCSTLHGHTFSFIFQEDQYS